MMAQHMVGPSQQWASLADGARPKDRRERQRLLRSKECKRERLMPRVARKKSRSPLGGTENEREETTREESVEEKRRGTNSMQEEKPPVEQTHDMVAKCLVGPRSTMDLTCGRARNRRKVWRAATRAAQEVRKTGKVAGKERREWEKGETERRESNTLHIVLHLQPSAAAPAAAAGMAAAVAAKRLQ